MPSELEIIAIEIKMSKVKPFIVIAWYRSQDFSIKGCDMGCAYVTHLRLTKSRFCIRCVIMNHFKANMMVSSRGVDSKVLRITL